jgi:hypothetical protein
VSEPQEQASEQCTSYQRDIRPKFTGEDVDHMRDFGLDLDDYQSVRTNAEGILRRLLDANVPMPPRPRGPWSQDWIGCFRQWMANGSRP